MIEEIRIDDLGVIGRAHVELGPGLTVLTGETGAGKTMVLTALNLLLGGKADPATVRVGRDVGGRRGSRGAGAGARRRSSAPPRRAPSSTTTARWCCCARSARRPTARPGGRGRSSAAARCRRACSPSSRRSSSPCTARRTRRGCARPRDQREALDAFVGAAHRDGARAATAAAWAERARVDAELTDLVDRAQDRTREAELLRLGLAEVERVDPQPDEDVTLAEEVERLAHAEDLRTAAAGAHTALVGDADGGRRVRSAVGLVEQARRRSSTREPRPGARRARHARRRGGLPAGRRRDRARGLPRGPAGRPAAARRRAAAPRRAGHA